MLLICGTIGRSSEVYQKPKPLNIITIGNVERAAI
jgi:hypothetical protein